MRNYKRLLKIFLLLAISAPNFSFVYSATFFVDSSTPDSLREKYTKAQQGGAKVKVLIVPGHDNAQGGTEFKGIKESAINAYLGEQLAQYLKKDPYFDVVLLRSQTDYNPIIKKYFAENRAQIKDFIKKHASTMKELVGVGAIDTVSGVEHNEAPAETILKLYGTNKWANENGVDFMIHIHFNDYGGRKWNQYGTYSGFAIYTPEAQYSNAKTSNALAQTLFDRLKTFYPVSNISKERVGVVPDQELVAIGANNTLDPASVLIEYGYIYESGIQTKTVKNSYLKDLAFQTFLGVEDFFGVEKNKYPLSHLPFSLTTTLQKGDTGHAVLALQSGLALQGFYPPAGKDSRTCPLAGSLGPCTLSALKNFQADYKITGEVGKVGAKTRKILNSLYGE